MTETNTHKDVKVLFLDPDTKTNELYSGTITMRDLYATGQSHIWVKNSCGDMRYVARRNFHIVDEDIADKPTAIVCDIDGVMNFIPSRVHGTTHRDRILLEDGTACQWTELNLSATAKHNLINFELLAHYARRGHTIIFLTARGDTQRVQTEQWLRKGFEKVGQSFIQFTLFMRGWSANDLEAPAMKAQMMQSCILPNYEVLYFIEDCAKNCAAMKLACPNIPIMQIHG